MNDPEGEVRTTQLQRLVLLLGEDVFFVPCEWGTKKPLVTYVERPFEGTKSPAYRALFDSEPRNIAVYLGKASSGLCAIDFDIDDDLAAFLMVNPKLAQTARSRGSRGGMVWLRIEGDYPASCNTSHFEWRADKRLSTIWGRHPKGMDYGLVVEAAPVKLWFEEIVWPEDWELPWRLTPVQQLERELGPALAISDKGAVKLNQGFIVGKLLREHDVLYDDLTRRFYRYAAENGLWSHVSEVRSRNSSMKSFAG
jgi:hypothetical protein